MEKFQEIWETVVDFMHQNLKILEYEFQMWMIFAAAAGLILIILSLILIISGIKRKKRRQSLVREDNHTRKGELETNEAAPVPESGILSIGDEDTVNLESMDESGGIVMQRDDETTDIPLPVSPQLPRTKYLVQIQMHYAGLVLEARPILTEDGPITIGRGEGPEITIKTNPQDTSVSHHHGTIFLQNDLPYYQDESRNGTILNNTRNLHKGELVQLPQQTKIQLDVGTHKILLFVIKQQ